MVEESSKLSYKCSVCKKPAREEYRPFCSKRCADVDLGKWLGGYYAIPAVEVDDPDMIESFEDDENI